jgi:hypothetical protein
LHEAPHSRMRAKEDTCVCNRMIYRKLQINLAPMHPHDETPCAEMEIFAYCPETRFPGSSGAAAPGDISGKWSVLKLKGKPLLHEARTRGLSNVRQSGVQRDKIRCAGLGSACERISAKWRGKASWVGFCSAHQGSRSYSAWVPIQSHTKMPS